MSNPIEKWYNEINIAEYEEKLKELPPIFLIEEFQTIINLFGSSIVVQERVSNLYDLAYSELLYRLSK